MKSKKSLGLLTFLVCIGPLGQAAQSPDPAVQAYIDAEVKSLEFPLSYSGDISANVLVGRAAQLFKVWSDSNGNPQVHSRNLDHTVISVGGHTYWAIVAGSTNQELGGQFINYVAIADTTTGALVAEGTTPPSPIQWQSELKIAPFTAPAQYQPIIKPVTQAQTSAFFISEWESEFDEVAIKNETYTGSDANGNTLQMSWNANGGSLSVKFLKAHKTVASFTLTPTTKITGSNYDQSERDTVGSYLVVQTGTSALWIHTFEGNTKIRIQTGGELSEFDFNIDHSVPRMLSQQ